MQVVDYSEVFFETIQSRAVPDEFAGKLVVVESRDSYCIFCPQAMVTFHANIVERFMTLRKVPGRYNAKGDEYTLNHPDWSVLGGAHFKLEPGLLKLFGSSLCYGAVDLEQLAKELQTAGGFRGVTDIHVTDS